MEGFSNRRGAGCPCSPCKGSPRESGRSAPSAGKQEWRVRSASSGSAATRALLLLLTVLVVAFVVIWGISSRRQANAQLSQETQDLAIPTVTVVHPKRGAPQQEIVLPGDMQPYTDAPIYARTTGYLKSWHVEMGARVKTGQLLAEIDTPEVDQQLQQARADLATVEANLHLAETTATRYKDLMKTDSVSQQDVDNATGNYDARKTAVESARSNVRRLEELQSFKKIYAPFDGVITARNTDIGALIDSGSGGGTTRELFHIAAVSRLRVYVNVPQLYSPHIKSGLRAELTLAEFPGRRFEGSIVRDSGAIDNATRTLLTEIDVNNSSGLLKPGGYVEVHVKLPSATTTFTLPVNSIIFRAAGMQVATVKNGKTIDLISIVPGRDFGTEIEVLAGLQGDESVVINPPDAIMNGEAVRLTQAQSPTEGNR
jgi:RND family efflux transporter MFP subunit